MPSTPLSGRRLPRFLLPLLATFVVAASIFYSGIHASGPHKDGDAQFFYATARCWAEHTSPYEPATYDAMFRRYFGPPDMVLTVAYMPTVMVLVMPMAPFSWDTAAKIFELMNFTAAMVLFWACYRLVRETVGTELRAVHWFWVVLGSTVGGIAGTVLTGQTSVMITAACAVVLVGCRLQRTWLTVIGIVIASAKPHLAGPLLLFVLLFEPLQRKAVAIAAGIFALVAAYAASMDRNIIASYLESVRLYQTIVVTDQRKLVGLIDPLLRIGLSLRTAQLIGTAGIVVVLGLAGWLLWRSRRSLSSVPLAMMLVVFSIGMARAIQGYDICFYAIALALVATLGVSVQRVLLVPALMMWRPGLILFRHRSLEGSNLVATLAWLMLLIVTAVMAVAALRKLRDGEGSYARISASGPG